MRSTDLDTMASSIDDIAAAARRIQPYIHCAPVVTRELLDKQAGCELIARHVDNIFTTSNAIIVTAIRLVWSRLKLLVDLDRLPW